MTNSEIRKRAWEVFKVSPVPLLILACFSSVADFIPEKLSTLPFLIVLLIVSYVINIGGYYMLIRGWIEGKSDLKHLLVPFQNTVYRRKIIPVMLAEWGILFVAALPASAVIVLTKDPLTLIMSGAFILLLLLLVIVVAVAISLVWYIFVMEPESKVTEMFRKSAVYMSRHWAGMLWFGFSLVIIPTIITAIRMSFIDSRIVSLLLIPVDAYIVIARVGYVYEKILTVEKNRELQHVNAEPVTGIEQAETEPVYIPDEESIEQITERLTEEAEKDIRLKLPVVETEHTDKTDE